MEKVSLEQEIADCNNDMGDIEMDIQTTLKVIKDNVKYLEDALTRKAELEKELSENSKKAF